jgi:adenine-specific DNA-methyltransferase
MDGQSLDIKQNNAALLREFFPNVFLEGKLDFEKFKAAFCDDIDANPAGERYSLGWAGKADAFRALQERTAATLIPQPELSVNFDTAENVFIEGENLEVLKVLQKSYYNSVKCVIIDPPYNTGNDSFIYPDRFKENLEEYEKRAGERDEDGYLMKEGLFRKNSKENGHYHSNWLSMMLPRLFLARGVMLDDGVIFVHIDDNEVHNLRMVMNEIFGEENFVGEITVQSNPRGRQSDTFLASVHDYLLIYSKNSWECSINGAQLSNEQKGAFALSDEKGEYRLLGLRQRGSASLREDRPEMYFPIYVNPIDGQVSLTKTDGWVTVLPKKSDGRDGRWMWGKEKCKRDIERLVSKLIERRGEYDIFVKDFLNREDGERTRKHKTVWDNKKYNNQYGTQEVKALLNGDFMTFPKSTCLIKDIIHMGTLPSENAIVLDFFAGSGSTAHAVMELNKEDDGNRKFILVQLPELCDESSEAHKAGYRTIADISRERIRRVIQKIGGNAGFKSYKLSPSNFKVWRGEEVTEENLLSQIEVSVDRVKPECLAEALLVELMLKSGYKLTDKVENRGDFYYIDGELVIVLSKMDAEIAAGILGLVPKPQKVIVLDSLFAGNDELKTNTALQLRDAGVGFGAV